MYIHGNLVCSISREVVVIHTDKAWLREVDGIGARVIPRDRVGLVDVHQENRAAILAGDSSQYGGIPHPTWQGIRVIDLACS